MLITWFIENLVIYALDIRLSNIHFQQLGLLLTLQVPSNFKSLSKINSLFGYYEGWLPRYSDIIRILILPDSSYFLLYIKTIVASGKLKEAIANSVHRRQIFPL